MFSLLALVVLLTPFVALIRPDLIGAIRIGPIYFRGETGVRIGGGI